MHPTRTYDYLTDARRRIFDWTRPLTPEQYTRSFPIGRATIARTLTHICISEWYYIQRMLERDLPSYDCWPTREEDPPPFGALESAWNEQAAHTRAVLEQPRDWEAPIEYRVVTDEGVPTIVTTTPAGLFTQLAFHEIHHRAQVMAMLRHLGIPAQDLDYNAMKFSRRPASEEP